MAQPPKVTRRVIDGHSHIGEMAAFQFYDLKEPVKPTVYEFADRDEYLHHFGLGRRRARSRDIQLRHPCAGAAVQLERGRARRG